MAKQVDHGVTDLLVARSDLMFHQIFIGDERVQSHRSYLLFSVITTIKDSLRISPPGAPRLAPAEADRGF